MPMLPSLIIGSITSGAYVLSQITGNTQIPLGEALAAFVFVVTLVAWLSRKLQRIEDDIQALKRDIATRPCQVSQKDCPAAERE
jgi:hypothetical protein